MKQLGHLFNEAKATYCGRCGTTHVPPAKGGTCPALEEEADKGIRIAKVMHKGKHVANVITYRGRGGNWVSGAETPDGQNATKKYGIGLIDTKKEIMKKIKQHHMNEAVGDVTVKTISAADAWKKHTDPKTTKSKVPVDPKTGKTLYQKVTSEEVDQIDEVSAAKLRDYADKASDARGHRNLSTAKLDKRYKSMALAHEKIRQRHAMVPATEEKMKTLSQFINEAKLNEAHDVELKPHSNGTHYIVHKIHPSSGIEKDQLKVGEKISDTHVDDLHDMGYSVKIHKK